MVCDEAERPFVVEPMIVVGVVVAAVAAYLYALRLLSAPILTGDTEPDEEER